MTELDLMLADLRLAAHQISQTLVEVAPDALALLLAMTRIESIGYLVVGVILTAVAAYGMRFGLRTFARLNADPYNRNLNPDFYGPLSMFSLIIGGSCAVAAGMLLLNIWNWIGTFAPHLKLARDVMNKVLQ